MEIDSGAGRLLLRAAGNPCESGERVRLVIRNQGSVAHDWHVDALDLSSPLIQPGQSATFEFTAGAAGTYQTICTEPGHEALGMVGTLIIE